MCEVLSSIPISAERERERERERDRDSDRERKREGGRQVLFKHWLQMVLKVVRSTVGIGETRI
jgi:hypothetical protein